MRLLDKAEKAATKAFADATEYLEEIKRSVRAPVVLGYDLVWGPPDVCTASIVAELCCAGWKWPGLNLVDGMSYRVLRSVIATLIEYRTGKTHRPVQEKELAEARMFLPQSKGGIGGASTGAKKW